MLFRSGNGERFPARLLLDLRQPKRSREAGRSAADDQDVDFECFAFHVRSDVDQRGESLLAKLGDDCRRDFEKIAGNTVVGHLENRGIRIFVHSHDRPGAFHAHHVLDRP